MVGVRCPAGHLAIRKVRQGKKRTLVKIKQTCITLMWRNVRFVLLGEDVTGKAQKQKTYSITIKSELHKEQMAFQQTDHYRIKSKERYKIEAKKSKLRNVHGYGRANSYGIQNMEIQGAMAIFTVNLKRILKLI